MHGTVPMMARIIGITGNVRPVILRPARRQRPASPVGRELAPGHAAGLAASATGENQKLDELAEVVVAAGAPDRGDLVVAQYAVTRLVPGWLARADDRVGLTHPFLHAPRKKGRQLRSRLAGRSVAALALNQPNAQGDILALDRIERHAV